MAVLPVFNVWTIKKKHHFFINVCWCKFVRNKKNSQHSELTKQTAVLHLSARCPALYVLRCLELSIIKCGDFPPLPHKLVLRLAFANSNSFLPALKYRVCVKSHRYDCQSRKVEAPHYMSKRTKSILTSCILSTSYRSRNELRFQLVHFAA